MLLSADQGNAGSDPHDALENLTPAEKKFLRGCLPTEAESMVSWAMPVLAAPAFARATLVAGQIEVLEGLQADPEEWCVRALKLALEARGARHG